jgi:hypothetical protein
MSRTLTAALLAVAFCLFVCCAGRKSEPPPADNILLSTDVDTVVGEVNSFTDGLEKAVESAQSPRDGVAEAQRLLDGRRPTLASKVAAVKSGEQIQKDAAAKRKWSEAEADNTFRVHGLVTKYFDASMRDPELKARLDKLVADYDSMFKDSPAR